MSKEPNNIDRIVREKLDGFEMAPPPSVWNATEAAIAKPKKRFFLWLFLGMTALVFVAMGAYFFMQDDSEKTLLAKEKSENGGLNDLERLNDEGLNDEEEDKNIEKLKDSGSFGFSENGSGSGSDGASSNVFKAAKYRKLMDNDGNLNDPTAGNGSSQNEQWDAKNDPNKENMGSTKVKSGSNSSLKTNEKLTKSLSTNVQSNNSDENSGSDELASKNDDDASSKTKNGNEQMDKVSNFAKKHPFNALPTHPAPFLETGNQEPVASGMEGLLLPASKPFWKVFSVEGAIGISTFNNKATQDTEPQLLELLDNAATNRRSYDFRLGLNYYFTRQLSFQAGIEFNASREDYSYNNETTTSSTSYDSVGVYFDSTLSVYVTIFDTITTTTTSVQTKKHQNYYRLLTLPFHFAWNKPLSIRSELEFAVGGTLSVYGRNKGATIFDSDTLINASQAYHTSGMLSLGGSIKYLYNLGDRHAVYIEPWVQFGITNQFAPQLTYESLRNSYGVRFGYRFYF